MQQYIAGLYETACLKHDRTV